MESKETQHTLPILHAYLPETVGGSDEEFFGFGQFFEAVTNRSWMEGVSDFLSIKRHPSGVDPAENVEHHLFRVPGSMMFTMNWVSLIRLCIGRGSSS